MLRKTVPCALVFVTTLFHGPNVSAQGAETGTGEQQQAGGWATFVRGGGIYQSEAALDNGGGYDAARYNIEIGRGYRWNPRTEVSLTLSYSYDDYSFSGGEPGSIAARSPWDGVHTYSVSAPMRTEVKDEWSAFVIPSLRSTGESSADFDDTVTGGAITGLSYRFGDRLTIGPGVGVLSQLEDSVSVFPFLVINWKITDRFSLETGQGLAATQGPGLTLTYRASQKWSFGMGGRYEKLRFRLDNDGDIAGGVGEETSVPLFFSGSYTISPKARLSLVGGMEVGGELTVEDADGNTLIEESSDPSLFGGITFNMRL